VAVVEARRNLRLFGSRTKPLFFGVWPGYVGTAGAVRAA
jgi:hypothetical protein